MNNDYQDLDSLFILEVFTYINQGFKLFNKIPPERKEEAFIKILFLADWFSSLERKPLFNFTWELIEAGNTLTVRQDDIQAFCVEYSSLFSKKTSSLSIKKNFSYQLLTADHQNELLKMVGYCNKFFERFSEENQHITDKPNREYMMNSLRWELFVDVYLKDIILKSHGSKSSKALFFTSQEAVHAYIIDVHSSAADWRKFNRYIKDYSLPLDYAYYPYFNDRSSLDFLFDNLEDKIKSFFKFFKLNKG